MNWSFRSQEIEAARTQNSAPDLEFPADPFTKPDRRLRTVKPSAATLEVLQPGVNWPEPGRGLPL